MIEPHGHNASPCTRRRNRIRPRRSAIWCLAIGIIVWGCGGPQTPVPPGDALSAGIDPSLPLIELPHFHLGRPLTLEEQRSPQPFGPSIPFSSFSVLAEASAPDYSEETLRPAIFRVRRKGSSDRYLTTSSCFLKPVFDEERGMVRFEGTCPQPVSTGPCLVDVTIGGKVFLIRAVVVR
jgi:hypothetical protein